MIVSTAALRCRATDSIHGGFLTRKTRTDILPVALAAGVNFILFGVKLYSGLVTASLCIYTDAVNNLFDALSCLLAAGGLALSGKAKNGAYPDGYGRAEDLAGFLMAVSVAFTGAYFAYRALERFLYPRPVNFQLFHALLLAVTVLVKLAMGIVFRRLSKGGDSVILKTICTDSFSDCGVTVMTLLSFLLAEYAGLRADSIFGLVISGIIIYNAVKLVRLSGGRLLGKNDEARNGAVRELLLSCGFTQAEVKTYATGHALTAAAEVEGGGDEAKARALIKEQTGADLFLSRR